MYGVVIRNRLASPCIFMVYEPDGKVLLTVLTAVDLSTVLEPSPHSTKASASSP
ncbi:hypothetical protein D3C73_1101210 [compost metagenome]